MTPLLTMIRLLDDVPEPDEVTPGWVYPVVFFGLVLATLLLWLSMRKQLKKVRFDENPGGTGTTDAPGSTEKQDPAR
jgi:hypothetical protein